MTKGKISKRAVTEVAAIIEGRIMNLSVETKVAIAVATSFVVLMVGAMAQGSERGGFRIRSCPANLLGRRGENAVASTLASGDRSFSARTSDTLSARGYA